MGSAPLVFISYAGPDVAHARRLADALEARDVHAFVADRDLAPGTNIVLGVQDRLTAADYVVLLLSHDAINRAWVDLEWTTTLARELRERKVFLFVVRLDDVTLPPVLSARRVLDADGDVASVVPTLVDTWHWDVRRHQDGLPVRPAPSEGDRAPVETVGIYVRNRAFGVQHHMRVPRHVTGHQLHARVRGALQLRPSTSELGGHLVLTYTYRLMRGDEEIPAGSDEPVAVFEETTLDLEVEVHLPPREDGVPMPPITYRPWTGSLAMVDPPTRREIERLMAASFRHLQP